MWCFRLLREYSRLGSLAIVVLTEQVNTEFCNGGHFCSPPKECCPLGCCLVFTSSGYRPKISQTSQSFSSLSDFVFWNHWLFWIFFFSLLFIFMCGCGMWKKRQLFANRMCNRSSTVEEERSELDSTGSCYPPPQYSRCSSFHFAPPPYTEVTTKPDLYPLVISYRSDTNKSSDNCLMVQYYRNYVVHPTLGSLSGGSTVDSISSSFFNQSAHENDANCLPTYEESRIEEMNSFEREYIPLETTLRCQQNQFLSQAQVLRNSNHEPFLECRSFVQNEFQPGIENMRESTQKTSMTVLEFPKLKSNLPERFENLKSFQNVEQSLKNELYFKPRVNQNTAIRPNKLYFNTLKQINNKSILISTSADSICDKNIYHTHQYSSDIILAQPQSYCESNTELHYCSSDILNHPSNFINCVNDSYSSEDNLSQPRGSLQDFVSSDGLSHSQFSNLEMNNFSTSSDVSSLQGCGSPDSPPQATSPTGEFLNLLDKIQKLPVQRDISKNLDLFNTKDHATEESAHTETSERHVGFENDVLHDSDLEEKSCLLKKPLELNTRKVVPLVPSKSLYKKNFLKRSKTSYMPFCQKSPSFKQKNNLKLSTSEPVTPVSSTPTTSTTVLSLSKRSNSFASKKNVDRKEEDRSLLNTKEENADEIF